jgi:hypothetical protein
MPDEELAITVIATGFDGGYFRDDDTADDDSADTAAADDLQTVDQKEMDDIDMDFQQNEEPESTPAFHKQDDDVSAGSSIWHYDENDESDTPAFLRRRKKNEDEADSE